LFLIYFQTSTTSNQFQENVSIPKTDRITFETTKNPNLKLKLITFETTKNPNLKLKLNDLINRSKIIENKFNKLINQKINNLNLTKNIISTTINPLKFEIDTNTTENLTINPLNFEIDTTSPEKTSQMPAISEQKQNLIKKVKIQLIAVLN
jgi:hypothetical protein